MQPGVKGSYIYIQAKDNNINLNECFLSVTEFIYEGIQQTTQITNFANSGLIWILGGEVNVSVGQHELSWALVSPSKPPNQETTKIKNYFLLPAICSCNSVDGPISFRFQLQGYLINDLGQNQKQRNNDTKIKPRETKIEIHFPDLSLMFSNQISKYSRALLSELLL